MKKKDNKETDNDDIEASKADEKEDTAAGVDKSNNVEKKTENSDELIVKRCLIESYKDTNENPTKKLKGSVVDEILRNSTLSIKKLMISRIKRNVREQRKRPEKLRRIWTAFLRNVLSLRNLRTCSNISTSRRKRISQKVWIVTIVNCVLLEKYIGIWGYQVHQN